MVKVRDVPKVKVVSTPQYYMQKAIEEMRKSKSEHTNKTDPKVGAVLVSPDNKKWWGAHRGEIRKGEHAEFTMIERKKYLEPLEEYNLYTTLEPCVDRNPPKDGCGFRIINSKVSKVYIGHLDPDPKVAGDGVEVLKQNGIEVDFFDKEYEKIIHEENLQYFKEASDRAKVVHNSEIQQVVRPLKREIEVFNISDLSEEALKELKRRVNLKFEVGSDDFNSFLYQMNFLKKSDRTGILKPTGLGLLLLGNNPQLHLPQSSIKFSLFSEGEQPYLKDFEGPLILIPDKIDEFLETYFSKSISRDNFQRKRIFGIPYPVVREVIMNAILHRDYELQNQQVKINFSDDKIEILSPGMPLVSLDKIKAFIAPPISRNPKIAYIFNQMGLIEERGMGMKELRELKTIYGLPKPDIRFEDGYLITTIFRITLKELKQPILEKLSPSELKGYNVLLSKEQISSSNYAKALGISVRTASRHLNKFAELELAIPEGKGKARIYKINE